MAAFAFLALYTVRIANAQGNITSAGGAKNMTGALSKNATVPGGANMTKNALGE